MTIAIEHEGSDSGPYEQCCFCWRTTPMWTALPDREPGEQVACCQSCAGTHVASDVPTKVVWCDDAYERLSPSKRARRPAGGQKAATNV